MPRKTIFNKQGLIPGETLWTDAGGLSDEELNSKLSEAMNFYAANVDKKDIKKDLFTFLKVQKKFSPKEQKIVRANADEIVFTAYKAARIINIGFPLNNNVANNIIAFINEQVEKAIKIGDTSGDTDKSTPSLTPLERIESNVNDTIITELEVMLDTWMEDTSKKAEGIDLANLVKTAGIPLQGYRFVYGWLDSLMEELAGAITRSDEYAVESYSHLKRPILNSWHRALFKMKDGLVKVEDKQKEFKKKTRKKRVKKPKNAFAARKQLKRKTAKVKYLEECPELSLKSENPEHIIGAQQLYVYNTKTKKFGYFQAANRDGLDIKGTSVKNFDEAVSGNIRLRKPAEFLTLFSTSGLTTKKIENAITNLTTKPTRQTGRLNEHVIILKTNK